MGSLRRQQYKRFLPTRLPSLVSAFIFLFSLVSCLPVTENNHLEFFFSERVWGGSPFSEAQKKQVFVKALEARDRETLSEAVPFEVDNSAVSIKRFMAIYEVDASVGLPKVRSGYSLELTLPTPPLEHIKLTNKLTGVAWSVSLTPPRRNN
jgi:hypothetical protein